MDWFSHNKPQRQKETNLPFQITWPRDAKQVAEINMLCFQFMPEQLILEKKLEGPDAKNMMIPHFLFTVTQH